MTSFGNQTEIVSFLELPQSPSDLEWITDASFFPPTHFGIFIQLANRVHTLKDSGNLSSLHAKLLIAGLKLVCIGVDAYKFIPVEADTLQSVKRLSADTLLAIQQELVVVKNEVCKSHRLQLITHNQADILLLCLSYLLEEFRSGN